MITRVDLDKYDTQGMYKIYDIWPEIAYEYYEKKTHKVDDKNIDNIVFSGMGGSGTIGDVFSSILSKTNIHVSVVKGYLLPKTVDANTLVITTSVSGNTVETLKILSTAQKHNCKLIAFSSGGKIQKYCKKNNIQHTHIPQFHSPRASFTAYLYSMLNVLESIIPVRKQEIKESLEKLEKLREKILSTNLTSTNESLVIARWIKSIPIIYYPWGLQAAAIRFKNSLQENAKMHVMAEDIIEASHNGIVAWERPSVVQPILIQGEDDYIKTKERWRILKEYFKINNIDYNEVHSVKGNIISKLINLIYLLDYCSIYKAITLKIDPSPISSIDFIKTKL